jgi:hypothetical protein
LDLSSGAGVVLGTVDDGTGISIGAITVTQSGILVGVSDRASVSKPSTIFTIDKQSGTATALIQLSISEYGQGVTFNADDGLVYQITGFSELLLQAFDPANPQSGVVGILIDSLPLEPSSFLHLRSSDFIFSTTAGELYLLNALSGKVTYLSAPGSMAGMIAVPKDASCNASLYGTGPSEGPQFLSAIDPSTGQSSLVGAIGFNAITGMGFAPDGVLYATGTRGDDSGERVLLTIDPCSGKGTEVGSTGAPLRGLSIQADGTALTYVGSALSKVDRTTAVVTPIGDSGIVADDFGIDFSSVDNKFYFARIFNGIGDLFSIDTASGSSTLEFQPSLPANISALRAVAFNPTDHRLYALVAEGGIDAPTYLSVMDTSAHTVSLVASTSGNMRTLAFRAAPENFLLEVLKEGVGAGSVVSAPVGIDCGPACSASFPSDAEVSLTATAAAGSSFAGWSGACTGTGSCHVNLDSDRAVTATFNPLPVFPLAIHLANAGAGVVSGSGVSCSDPACSASLLAGSAVVLFANANAEWIFTGWSGACTGTATCTVTMDGTKDVTAHFFFIGPFTLPLSPAASTTVSAGQSAVFNIALQSHPANNSTLTLNCSGLPTGTACSFSPNNIPLTAGTSSSTTTQLTITTTAPTLAFGNPSANGTFLAIGLFATVITCARRRRALRLGAASLLLLLLPACGGGGEGTVRRVSQSGTPVGSYTITVTGTTGSTIKSTTVALIVK